MVTETVTNIVNDSLHKQFPKFIKYCTTNSIVALAVGNANTELAVHTVL